MIDANRIRDFTDVKSAYQFAAGLVVQTLIGNGTATVTLAVSGGSSPIRLFELLAQASQTRKILWERVVICWVDERMVLPDHAYSNYGLAKKWLLNSAPLSPGQVFPMRTDYPSPDAAAQAYEQTLRTLFCDQEFPRFDLILLGMGSDGHIASLFPGDPALKENTRWVAAVPDPGMDPLVPRLTLTLPVLNQAKRIIALVPGAGKRDAFMDASTNPKSELPAALLAPLGEIFWLTCFCEPKIGHCTHC